MNTLIILLALASGPSVRLDGFDRVIYSRMADDIAKKYADKSIDNSLRKSLVEEELTNALMKEVAPATSLNSAEVSWIEREVKRACYPYEQRATKARASSPGVLSNGLRWYNVTLPNGAGMWVWG